MLRSVQQDGKTSKMLHPAVSASGHVATLLPGWRIAGIRGKEGGDCEPSTSSSGRTSCRTGYALLAAAVVLWLALMDVGQRGADSTSGTPGAIRWMDSSGTQLHGLGRLLLTGWVQLPGQHLL